MIALFSSIGWQEMFLLFFIGLVITIVLVKLAVPSVIRIHSLGIALSFVQLIALFEDLGVRRFPFAPSFSLFFSLSFFFFFFSL